MGHSPNRYRKAFIGCSFLALMAGGVGLALMWSAVSRQPDFYRVAVAQTPPLEIRQEAARIFSERTAELVEGIRTATFWQQEFTQDQVNSWLIEELPRQFGDQIPSGFADPRVDFDSGVVRVGFRYRSRQFDGVISLVVRPEVPVPNQLALTVESLSAGLLPLALANFTQEISSQLDRHGIDHDWQIDGEQHILSVQIVPEVHSSRRWDSTPVLESIAVEEDRLRIAGHRKPIAALTLHPTSPRRQTL